MANSTLALFGGNSVYTGAWPTWPVATARTTEALAQTAASGRWAISGSYTGQETWEKRFTRDFAAFLGTRYAVPTANGTSALTISLEALGVEHGTEVLVPGLTWVACASATAALGAVPVLVDVNEQTFAMSLQAAEAAISPCTSAILLVHPYCQVADPIAFRALADRKGIALIEDCSQAHGAEWNHQKVGTFGNAGAFSLQQVKVLTCGEGGIAVTSNADVYDRMQQLRADGRRYADTAVVGQLELEEIGSIQGRNYCMSEFQAAVATAQLEDLDHQNMLRQRTAEALARDLSRIPGVSVPQAPEQVTRRTIYQLLVHLDPAVLGPYEPDLVVAALGAETGAYCELIDTPLNRNRLYDPLLSPRTPRDPSIRSLFDPRRFHLPIASKVRAEHVAFGHWVLLGDETHRQALIDAFVKVTENIDALRTKQP